MTFRPHLSLMLPILVVLACLASPIPAQQLEVGPQPAPFPVLDGGEFLIDPTEEVSNPLFRFEGGTLTLRATPRGSIDMQPFCKLPKRYWGPLSVIQCSLEVSGQKPMTGMSIPARVSLADAPMGSTVTFKMLVQAPIIVLDLNGNPTPVLDTFVEEYRWTLASTKEDRLEE